MKLKLTNFRDCRIKELYCDIELEYPRHCVKVVNRGKKTEKKYSCPLAFTGGISNVERCFIHEICNTHRYLHVNDLLSSQFADIERPKECIDDFGL